MEILKCSGFSQFGHCFISLWNLTMLNVTEMSPFLRLHTTANPWSAILYTIREIFYDKYSELELFLLLSCSPYTFSLNSAENPLQIFFWRLVNILFAMNISFELFGWGSLRVYFQIWTVYSSVLSYCQFKIFQTNFTILESSKTSEFQRKVLKSLFNSSFER